MSTDAVTPLLHRMNRGHERAETQCRHAAGLYSQLRWRPTAKCSSPATKVEIARDGVCDPDDLSFAAAPSASDFCSMSPVIICWATRTFYGDPAIRSARGLRRRDRGASFRPAREHGEPGSFDPSDLFVAASKRPVKSATRSYRGGRRSKGNTGRSRADWLWTCALSFRVHWGKRSTLCWVWRWPGHQVSARNSR